MATTVAVLTLLFLTALSAVNIGSSEKKDVANGPWAIIDHEYIEYTQEELDWMREEKEEKKDGRR